MRSFFCYLFGVFMTHIYDINGFLSCLFCLADMPRFVGLLYVCTPNSFDSHTVQDLGGLLYFLWVGVYFTDHTTVC